MSQPLSQKNKQRIPIKGDEKRNYSMVQQQSTQRTIPMREAITLLLVIVGVVCLPVGAGVAWGVGPAIFVLGAVALILGVLLGLL